VKILSDSVVVKYKTRREYCPCCNQKLLTPKTSEIKEFEFTKESINNWVNWKAIIANDDDFDSVVNDFIYETIDFFATTEDKFFIDKSEVEKIKKFILNDLSTTL
jgi:hypothetical protein